MGPALLAPSIRICYSVMRLQRKMLMDIRKDIYHDVPAMSLEDITQFHAKHFHDRKQVMLVLGKSGNLDMETLKKYGTVRELTLKEVFGY